MRGAVCFLSGPVSQGTALPMKRLHPRGSFIRWIQSDPPELCRPISCLMLYWLVLFVAAGVVVEAFFLHTSLVGFVLIGALTGIATGLQPLVRDLRGMDLIVLVSWPLAWLAFLSGMRSPEFAGQIPAVTSAVLSCWVFQWLSRKIEKGSRQATDFGRRDDHEGDARSSVLSEQLALLDDAAPDPDPEDAPHTPSGGGP